MLKAVLTAIDHHGRGRAGGCRASIATLARSANCGDRTCTRAIEVLQLLGLVCVTNDGPRWGQLGSPCNRYTIVWSELDVLCERSPLEVHSRQAARNTRANLGADTSASGPNHRATPRDQSATGTDQSATGTDQSASGTDQSATVAHKSSLNRIEALLNAPSDVDEDGARYFFEDEVAAVRFRANTINAWVAATEPDDRELVLKIATLWEDGKFPEDAIEQTLESFRLKRERGERIGSPIGWLWSCMRNQLAKHHLRFERLLATTEFPRELLPLPRREDVLR